jgi:hypothetical protein
VRGVGESSERCKSVAYGVDSVTNVVAKDLLVVFAPEQVVAIWVKAFVAVAAWVGLGCGKYHWQPQFALKEQCEHFISEAVVWEAAVVCGYILREHTLLRNYN